MRILSKLRKKGLLAASENELEKGSTLMSILRFIYPLFPEERTKLIKIYETFRTKERQVLRRFQIL